MFGKRIRSDPNHMALRSNKTQNNPLDRTPRMSKQPTVHAVLKIKRKRAPVWPFATTSMCERVVKLLAEDEFVRDLSPPRRTRGSTPRLKDVSKTSSTKGGSGSKMTLMSGTLPNCDNTLKTQVSQLEGPVSKEVSSPR